MDPMYASLFPAYATIGPVTTEARVVITSSTIHVFTNNRGIQEATYPLDPTSLPPTYPRAAFTLRTLDPATPEITVTPSGGCGCGNPLKNQLHPQVVQLAWPTQPIATATT